MLYNTKRALDEHFSQPAAGAPRGERNVFFFFFAPIREVFDRGIQRWPPPGCRFVLGPLQSQVFGGALSAQWVWTTNTPNNASRCPQWGDPVTIRSKLE